MKKIAVGVLAHVDSGKTTLSEAMMYCSGNIGKLGRVDHKNSFLDTFSLERDRGITIFSKQAILKYKDTEFTLLDTPGHVDFSAEMERTLKALDFAVLVVSCVEGVQAHTEMIWKLPWSVTKTQSISLKHFPETKQIFLKSIWPAVRKTSCLIKTGGSISFLQTAVLITLL